MSTRKDDQAVSATETTAPARKSFDPNTIMAGLAARKEEILALKANLFEPYTVPGLGTLQFKIMTSTRGKGRPRLYLTKDANPDSDIICSISQAEVGGDRSFSPSKEFRLKQFDTATNRVITTQKFDPTLFSEDKQDELKMVVDTIAEAYGADIIPLTNDAYDELEQGATPNVNSGTVQATGTDAFSASV